MSFKLAGLIVLIFTLCYDDKEVNECLNLYIIWKLYVDVSFTEGSIRTFVHNNVFD